MSTNDTKKISFELFYKEDITPNDDVVLSVKLLEDIKLQKDYSYKVFNQLSKEEEEDLKDEMRSAATRWKFKVVSSGGGALAISGSKKLNYLHGPILIVRKNRKIIQVFPRGDPGSKESRWTTVDFLNTFLSEDIPIFEVFRGQTFSEDDLRNLVKGTPSIIEAGLTYLDVEVEIESSRIDLVLIDKKKKHLLLEFKLNANDQTIGQVTRYSLDLYAKKFAIPKDQIRRGIVTLSVTGQIKEACKTQKIELYVIRTSNYGFKHK